MTTDQNPDYAVGYGKPPLSKQFPPGRSGNAKGRPRRAGSLITDLEQVLNQTVTVRENGRRKRISKRQLLAKQLVNQGISGERRSARMLLEVMDQGEPAQGAPNPAAQNALMRRMAKALDIPSPC
jgi:uncharacterized protein DUF5681